jgi:hypothetical protein
MDSHPSRGVPVSVAARSEAKLSPKPSETRRNTKKGGHWDTKPSDAFLPASYAGPKPALFTGGRGVA